MTKRARIVSEWNTTFPLICLPDDMIKLIFEPLINKQLNWLFGILFVNKDCYDRFPRVIRLLYTEGYHVNDGYIGHHRCHIPFRGLTRYMANLVHSIDSREKMCGLTIPCFYNLESLVLYGVHSVQIESLQGMSRLTHLDLTYNRGVNRDEYVNIHLLTGLRSLVLKENTTVRANELCQLTNLTKLDLTANFSVINRNTIMYLPNKLRILDLSHNQCIDDCDLRQLTNLTSLNLSMSQITDDGVSTLTNLETLVLHINRDITQASLTLLTNLRDLETRNTLNNYIYADSAGKLPSIRKLTIKDCYDIRPFQRLPNLVHTEKICDGYVFTIGK